MIPQRRVRCYPTTALKGASHSSCDEGAGATVVVPPGQRHLVAEVILIGIRAPSRSSCGCDVRRQSASIRSNRKNDDDGADAQAGKCLRAKRPSTISVRYVCTGTSVGIAALGPTRREAALGRPH
jgi:hypothetical protein